MEEVTVADWIPMIASVLFAVVLLVGLLKCTSKARGKTQRSLDRVRGRYAIVKSAYLQVAKLQGMEPPAMDAPQRRGAFSSLLDTLKILISNLQIIAQVSKTPS